MGVPPGETVYAGDDLPDLAPMALAGAAVAVPNAPEDVRRAADWLTDSPGGTGAIREIVEWLLRETGRWDDVLKRTAPRAAPDPAARRAPRPHGPEARFMTQRPSMIQKIRYYYNQRDLLLSYVRKDLKERYVGSVIGFYWSVLNPLILLGIYTFVFSVIFRVLRGARGLVHAALYIFCGMVPWMAFSEAVGRSTGVLIDNANLIKKVMFPSKILPMYLVFHAVNLLIGFAILLGAAILAGMPPLRTWPSCPCMWARNCSLPWGVAGGAPP